MKNSIKEGFWWVRQTPNYPPRIAQVKRFGNKSTITFFNHCSSAAYSNYTESYYLKDYPKIVFVKFISQPK